LIDKWHKLFVARLGAFVGVKRPGKLSVSEAKVDKVEAFVTVHTCFPTKVPHTAVPKILWKCLKLKGFRPQLLHYLTSQDKFATHFVVTLFQVFKMTNILQAKFPPV
jgi:hypothetical protein